MFSLPGGRSARGFLLATLTLALVASNAAYSQEDEDDDADGTIEEIVVTASYRDSLRSAASLKRDADRVLDAIVAIDIGKLPDSNVAEALQRVPGIQIDRERGEGTRVAIRGLSADLNRSEINRMTFAGTSNSREADFRNIPSQFISSIEVVKSPTASMTDGAVGGWVYINTRRPFDAGGGLQTAFTVKARGGPGNETDITNEYAPEYTLFVSNTFNEKFGASIMYNSVEHDSRADILEDLFWSYRDQDLDGTEEFVPQLPRYYQYIVSEKRESITGTLQFRPSDDLEFILDATPSTRDGEASHFVNNFVTYFVPYSDIELTGDTVTAFTNPWQLFQVLSSEFDEDRETSTYSLSAAWDVSDTVSLTGLAGRSTGEWNQPLVNVVPQAFPLLGPFRFSQAGSDNIWVTDLDLSTFAQDPLVFGVFQAIFSQQRIDQEEDLLQLDLEFARQAGPFSSFQTGVQYRTTSFDSVGALTFKVTVPALINAMLGDAAYNDFLASVMRRIPGRFGDVYSNNPPGVPDTFWVADSSVVLKTLFTPEELRNVDNYDDSVKDYGRVWRIEEKISGIYLQANVDASIGNLPLTGNVGVRYVRTETDTSGFGNGDVNDPRSFNNTYSEVLPALNLKLDLNNRMLLRFAASGVIARPTITDLTPSLTYNSFTLIAAGGNVELDPFKATQADLIFEYYPNEGTALAVGIFYKDVDSYIETQTIQVDLFGDGQIYNYLTPVNGEGAKIKGIELAANHSFANGFGVAANYTYVDSTSLEESQITGEPLPFPGLSKSSYNLTAFYEKGRISARVAYNFRDERLANSTSFGVLGLTSALFTEDYASLDASINFAATPNFTLFVSGSNLTDEYQRNFGPGGFNRNVSTITWGRFFEFGVHGTWSR